MRILLAPAKNLRTDGPIGGNRPQFADEAAYLAHSLRGYAPYELESLLKVNPRLAFRAFAHYQAFDPLAPGWQALTAYDGLAFWNLSPRAFTKRERDFAQEHLWVLSALYGLLRPMDAILPHRLEMACRFRPQGQSLYAFWGNKVYAAVFGAGETVVNLASKEYSQLVAPYCTPGDKLVTVEFLTHTRGKLRQPATEAKRCRGRMARWIIQNEIGDAGRLQAYTLDGYGYEPTLSAPGRYTFVRDESAG